MLWLAPHWRQCQPVRAGPLSCARAFGMSALAVYSNGFQLSFNPARSIGEALSATQPDWLLGMAVAFLAFLLTSTLAWVYTAFHARPEAKARLGWVFSPTRWLVILVLVLLAGWFIYQFLLLPMRSMNALSLVWMPAVALIPLLMLVISLLIWVRAGTLTPRPAAYTRIAWFALLLGLLVFLVDWTGFLLWAFGLIARYEYALILVILLITAVLVAGNIWVLRAIRRLMGTAW